MLWAGLAMVLATLRAVGESSQNAHRHQSFDPELSKGALLQPYPTADLCSRRKPGTVVNIKGVQIWFAEVRSRQICR